MVKQINTVTITGGEYRGRKILTPGGKTHPMGERERLALFNMLTGFLPGAKVLDVFAGSGALGIEALSRGALNVAFVDNSSDAVRVIKNNLESLGVRNNAEVIREDASKIDDILGEFDIVIADPPYDNFEKSILKKLGKMVKDGGTIVLSHPGEAPEIEGLTIDKTHHYARAYISIYHK